MGARSIDIFKLVVAQLPKKYFLTGHLHRVRGRVAAKIRLLKCFLFDYEKLEN